MLARFAGEVKMKAKCKMRNAKVWNRRNPDTERALRGLPGIGFGGLLFAPPTFTFCILRFAF